MVRSTRIRISRVLPLGFILLLIVGCALGPGYGAASKQRPVGQERNPTLENGVRAKKQQPVGQKPKEVPPTPTKPPAIGGSGG